MSSSPTSPGHSSSPFPSPSPSLPAWHFPFGPSSIYHQRERPKAHHSRFKSSYIPRAPVLSTEQRAHRRAQNSSLGSLISPPLSDCSRSPLSRFSTYSPATMALNNHHAPVTPAKSAHRSTCSLQDSPSSDYFSDDARSSINHSGTIASSDRTKALLVRMNKIQSQLMREQSQTQRQSMSIVEKKLSEIELELGALHAQTRLPSELDDSAIPSPGATGPVKTPSHSRDPSAHSVNSSAVFSDEMPTAEQYKAERDWLLVRVQELLDDLNTASSELRQRCNEVRESNGLHSAAIEERDTKIEQLQLENDAMRQDLGFEHSELLFLKLQMKSLECDISELRDEKIGLPPATQAERLRQEKKNRILSELDRWRPESDWQDVFTRFKRRRSKYGIPTSPDRSDAAVTSTTAGPDIEWQLEIQRESRGRVTSLTIKRMDSNYGEQIRAEKAVGTETVTLNGKTVSAAGALLPEPSTTHSTYVETSTQTDLTLTLPQPLDEDSQNTILSDTDQDQDVEIRDSGIDPDDEDDECAITTSASSEADREDSYQDVEEDEETSLDSPTLHLPDDQSGWRPAWKELWDGLQSLSGMADDDDEDE